MADRRSSAPMFSLYGVKWTYWIVEDGQHYEWRSQCGQMTVVRNVRTFVARRGDRIIGKLYPTIRAAMEAVQGTGT